LIRTAQLLTCYGSDEPIANVTIPELPHEPITPIISITIRNFNGTDVKVTNLTTPISFSPVIPISIENFSKWSESCPRRVPVSYPFIPSSQEMYKSLIQYDIMTRNARGTIQQHLNGEPMDAKL
jgi:hypothetical protein